MKEETIFLDRSFTTRNDVQVAELAHIHAHLYVTGHKQAGTQTSQGDKQLRNTT
jgi:hypothetical protein